MTNYQLVKFFDSVSETQFKWGQFDCAFFFTRYLKWAYGLDLFHLIEGEWDSKHSAVKFFTEKLCFEKFITSTNAKVIDDYCQAKQGDIVLFSEGDNWHTVGISYGAQVAVVTEGKGFHFTSLSSIQDNIIKIVRFSDNG